MLAASLKQKESQIRARHPKWAPCPNKDPLSYYLANGFLPYYLDAIPTDSRKFIQP
jgi:hypothetical protein